MTSYPRWLVPVVVLLLPFSACSKKAPEAPKVEPRKPDAVTLVPKTERSRHFAAVNRHLELGGTLYGYADIDGDALKLADGVHSLAEQVAAAQPMAAPFLKQDFAKLFSNLGLNDVKAFGFSSVPAVGGGFRNRAFFYMPDGRHGLLTAFGGPAQAFASARMAPADTDLLVEDEADLTTVYAAIRTAVMQVGGEGLANMMDASLKQAGAAQGFSLFDVIQSFKGRVAAVFRFDSGHTLTLPGPAPFVVPGFSMLVKAEGLGASLEGAISNSGLFTETREGTMKFYELKEPLPLAELHPVIAMEGSTLYLATTRAFLMECHDRKSGGLDQNAAFQKALAAVGREGNGLTYVTPALFARMKQLAELNPNAAPETMRMIKVVTAHIPSSAQPLVSVRTNLPDGILVQTFWYRSLKQDVAMMAMYNPVSLGLVAAMAIPAFQKVRLASQEKAIINNLRQLEAAADQYYLESGVQTASYDDLVGPDKYIRQIQSVAGENYHLIRFKQGLPLRVRTADGRIIQYPLR